jgi:hypothetical protein
VVCALAGVRSAPRALASRGALRITFVFVDVPGFVARLNWREPSRACVRASANTNEGKKNFAGFDTATRHGTNTLLAAVGLSRVSRSRGSVGL